MTGYAEESHKTRTRWLSAKMLRAEPEQLATQGHGSKRRHSRLCVTALRVVLTAQIDAVANLLLPPRTPSDA